MKRQITNPASEAALPMQQYWQDTACVESSFTEKDLGSWQAES